MTHIFVRNLIIIGSDYGLSPGRRQAIIWTNAGLLLIGPWETNFKEILIDIHTFSLKKIHLKMSSGKWRPFCLGLNVLIIVITSANTFPTNWRSLSINVRFTCALNTIVFRAQINFSVDVVRMVYFICVWLCFICVTFELTLGSCVFTSSLRCYRAHDELKVVSNQHIVNTPNILAGLTLLTYPLQVSLLLPWVGCCWWCEELVLNEIDAFTFSADFSSIMLLDAIWLIINRQEFR